MAAQGDLAAALAWSHPSPLLDEVHVCLLRLLALDEPRSVRALRTLDLGLLDAVTWPPYVWEYLRLRGDPLAALSLTLGRELPADEAPAGGHAAAGSAAESLGEAPGVRQLMRRPPFRARRRREYFALPAAAKAAVLAALAGYALEAGSVRGEIERREEAGEWVTGVHGAPGRWAMRSAEERAARAPDAQARARRAGHAPRPAPCAEPSLALRLGRHKRIVSVLFHWFWASARQCGGRSAKSAYPLCSTLLHGLHLLAAAVHPVPCQMPCHIARRQRGTSRRTTTATCACCAGWAGRCCAATPARARSTCAAWASSASRCPPASGCAPSAAWAAAARPWLSAPQCHTSGHLFEHAEPLRLRP